MRTTWFPGLGFLLKRAAWDHLKRLIPLGEVAMGWDYWFRIQFLDNDKHCIIPEVSRTHHVAKKGASVTRKNEVDFLDAMATETRPSPCTAEKICNAFGDVSYLVRESYDARLHALLEKSSVAVLDSTLKTPFIPDARYLVPFRQRAWFNHAQFFVSLGLLPSTLVVKSSRANAGGQDVAKVKKARRALWGSEVRSDYYGLIYTRHEQTLTEVLLVQRDSPSSAHFCPSKYRTLDLPPHINDEPQGDGSAPPQLSERSGNQSESCDKICDAHDERCDVSMFALLNTCAALRRHFKCEQGCAALVGKELPCYVSHKNDFSYQQCLVTMQGEFNCKSKHAHTNRLCPCVPRA
eukprot:GEMP01061523.1.p1 GENE.GEMP01061523.1~~GEMP01061523.1.p1  ORF type:complete len:350 (+),score=86.66 GEMP01061523.1:302-1351(+)